MLNQPLNPNRLDRYIMVKDALRAVERVEDFESIVNLTKPPRDILNIAPPMAFRNLKVGIIGGGVAGLASAYELRKLGYDITIFEANPERIGGRIYTHYFDKNHYGELGAMRIPVSHETTWHYIDLFKLKTNPFYYHSENDVLYIRNERIRGLNIEDEIRRKLYPKFKMTPNEKSFSISKLIEFIHSNHIQRLPVKVREEFYQIKENYSYPIYYYDYFNFRQILSNLGYSEALIRLFYGILGIESNIYHFNFLEVLKEYYSVNGSYVYEVNGGMINLPYAFLNSFKNQDPSLGNVKFLQGSHVTDILYDHHHKVKLKHLTNNNFYIDEFDYVICTIPFSKLRVLNVDPLFSPDKQQAIMELHYIPAQKTVFFSKERFWERPTTRNMLGGSAVTDLAINTMWFPSHIYDMNDPRSVFIASYNLSLDATRIGNLSKERELYTVKRQFEKVHGLPVGYLDDVLLDYKAINWNRDRFSLGAFRWDRSEQNRLFSYAAVTPEYDNHLFFAGEHTSQFHGWLQGSLQSAMYAANAIAQISLSRSR